MRAMTIALAMVATGCAGAAQEFEFEQGLDLRVHGQPWLRTLTTPHLRKHHETTKKVFTHIYDFQGEAPITKGAGGKYSHHRGLFIGWKDTLVNDRDYDTWHMPECYQEHREWKALEAHADRVRQVETVGWFTPEGDRFIKEERRIAVSEHPRGYRVIDFASTLHSEAGSIPLRGDLQHAGMQVRLANEVARHERTTRYLLPEGAKERSDDKVVGGWWACCSAEVRGTRYWVLHMTPPDHPTGEPVYSIRRYGRFGAFFEHTLEEGEPFEVHFRVVVSQETLSHRACERLYTTYAESRP